MCLQPVMDPLYTVARLYPHPYMYYALYALVYFWSFLKCRNLSRGSIPSGRDLMMNRFSESVFVQPLETPGWGLLEQLHYI